MKRLQTSALIFFAGLLLGWVGRGLGRGPDARDLARLDTLRAETAELDTAELRRRHDDSLAAARLAALQTRGAAARQQAAALGQAVAATLDTARAAAPDTLAPLFERLGIRHSEEIRSYELALAAADSEVAIERERRAAADSAARAAQLLLHRTLAQLEVATRRRPRRCGFGGTLGYGATSSGGVLRTGPSVAGGISCRL